MQSLSEEQPFQGLNATFVSIVKRGLLALNYILYKYKYVVLVVCDIKNKQKITLSISQFYVIS